MPPLTTLQQESLVSLKSPGFFLDWFSCVPSNRLHSSQPNPGFLQSLSLSTYPTPVPVGRQKSVIVWELLVSMQNSLCFALCTPLTVLASETLMVLPVPTTEWGFLVFRTFFSLIAPSQRHRSCPNSLVSFFFLIYIGDKLALLEVWGLLPAFSRYWSTCRYILLYLCGGRWSPRFLRYLEDPFRDCFLNFTF